MEKLHGKLTVKRLFGLVNIGEGRPTGDLQAKTVTPSQSQIVVTPDAEYYGLSRVTVEGMTLQDKTVAPGTSAQIVEPDEGYTGLDSVTVEAAPLQQKSIVPAVGPQEVVPDAGFYGLEKVTVEATPLQAITVTPGSEELQLTPEDGYIGFSSVTVEAVKDSGGSGGSGTGGDSGDGGDSGGSGGSGTGGDSGDGGDSGGTGDGTSEAETLPNVNDGSYGSDAEYTGMVYIGDELYPAFTENVLSQYPYIIKSSGLVNGDGFFCSEAPFVAKDGNESYELEPTYIQSSAEHGVSYRLLQSVDENGDFVGWYADCGAPYSWSFAEYGNDVISWSSHNLYGEDEGTIDTKFFSGTSAIKQVSTDSNGEEQYAKVSDSDMHALAVVTQNLTGTTEEMNMRDIISELEKHSVDTWEGGSY